jgi:hypothetical protein
MPTLSNATRIFRTTAPPDFAVPVCDRPTGEFYRKIHRLSQLNRGNEVA